MYALLGFKVAYNVFGLCVRWGFPALKPIVVQTLNFIEMTNISKSAPNDAKPVLSAGFSTLKSKWVVGN